MRLPLRHRPKYTDSEFKSCRYLDLIAEASYGLPLAPAVWHLTKDSDRGRYGSALQWHFGLDAHDRDPYPDWEGRIEIKLVSVWQRPDGRVGCDKLKVSDVGMDPWERLANVRFVFVDRLSRVIVGNHSFCLSGVSRRQLEDSWDRDPHFGQPDLFVEARESKNKSAPAYYLSAYWFDQQGILPQRALFPFDSNAWAALRGRFGRRDPYIIPIVPQGAGVKPICPRCGLQISVDVDWLQWTGYFCTDHLCAPLIDNNCPRGSVVIDQRRIPNPNIGSRSQQLQAILRPDLPENLQRLSELVFEPEDHMH